MLQKAIFFIKLWCNQKADKAAWEQCKELYCLHKYKDCEQLATQLVLRNPYVIGAWLLKGYIAIEQEKSHLAERAFAKALSLKPTSSKALCGMGVTMRIQGKFDLAEDYYYKALRLDSDNNHAKSSLMILELAKGNYDVAVALGEDSMNTDLNSSENGLIANLMIAYHYAGFSQKRDELFQYLSSVDYAYLYYLSVIMDHDISANDLIAMDVQFFKRKSAS